MEETKETSEKQGNKWLIEVLLLFIRLSGWVAIPVIAATFLGKWLDEKFQTEPWLMLVSVASAFFISIFGLVYNTIKEFKKIDKKKDL